MATINAQQRPQDVVSPTKGHYEERYTYVLDAKTKKLVRVKKEYVFTS